jgi:hypothetical protein
MRQLVREVNMEGKTVLTDFPFGQSSSEVPWVGLGRLV